MFPYCPRLLEKGHLELRVLILNWFTLGLTAYSESSRIDASTPSEMRCPLEKYFTPAGPPFSWSGWPRITPMFRTQIIILEPSIFGLLKLQSSEKIFSKYPGM